jgi:hypothetical protein
MIRLYMTGGLGNQLFEYATARAIAIRTGVPLEIDLRFYSKETKDTTKDAWLLDLPIKARVKRYERNLSGPHNPLRRAFEKLVLERFREVHVDKQLTFNERVTHLGSNAVLIGYFQSYKYFERCWDTISPELDMLRFVDTSWVSAIEKRAAQWCAVHVRRGDYVGDQRFEMQNPAQYYASAMRFVQETAPNTQFAVFSDDIAWCHTQSFLANCAFYEGASDRHPATDLATMSRATSNIICNSSYSWWAAWKGQRPGKVIVAPSIWFDGHRTADLQIVPKAWQIV